MSSDDTPEIDWDELDVSIDFHEVARFTRGGETRIYRLRMVPGGAELWRVVEMRDGGRTSIKETDLASFDEATAFFQEIERALRAGGWRQG